MIQAYFTAHPFGEVRSRLFIISNPALSRRLSARSRDNSIASGVTCLLPAPLSLPAVAALTQLRKVWSPELQLPSQPCWDTLPVIHSLNRQFLELGGVGLLG